MSIINQYSYILFSIAGGLILAGAMWRWRRPANVRIRVGVVVAYVAVIVLISSQLQFPSSNTEISSFVEVEAALNNGQPTFVMMYSHFCVGCIASLPSVRALESDLVEQGQPIDMLFLDIHTETGERARESLGFNITPTYILYDAAGKEVLRQNSTPSLGDLLTQLN